MPDDSFESLAQQMRREHPWHMRRARIRYEAEVLYWWIFHPIQMHRHNRGNE